jgi:hypothetical protein
MLVSGVPRWYLVVFIGFCLAFSLVGMVLQSWHFSFVVLLIAAGFLLMRTASPTVYLIDDERLVISRWGQTTVVPLDQVAGVTESKASWPFGGYHCPAIHFTDDNTPFGRSLYLHSFGLIPGMTFPRAVKKLQRTVNERAAVRN